MYRVSITYKILQAIIQTLDFTESNRRVLIQSDLRFKRMTLAALLKKSRGARMEQEPTAVNQAFGLVKDWKEMAVFQILE